MAIQPTLFPLPPARLDEDTADDIRTLLERSTEATATITVSGISYSTRTGKKITRSVKTEVDTDLLYALIAPRAWPRVADQEKPKATLSGTTPGGEHLSADLDDADAASDLVSRVVFDHH